MKSKPIFLLVASALLLSGCNEQPEDVKSSVPPEDETSQSSQATSKQDTTPSENTSKTDVVSLAADYHIVDGEGVEEIKVMEGGALTHKLIIDVENLPAGKTIDDCTFNFPGKIDRLAELKTEDGLAKNERMLVVENAGVYTGDVTVTCGSEKVDVHLEIEIIKDHSLYTPIATADAFKTQVLTATTGRFELTADINLGGAAIKGWEAGVVFGGILDGNGHSVTNFSVPPIAGRETGNGTEGGLWMHVGPTAIIRDVYMHGTINQPAGWGSLLGKEVQAGAIIENCLMEADVTYVPADPGSFDWTWCRSGIAAGFLIGTIRNSVFIKNAEGDQTMDVAPYAAPGAKIENVYTSNAANVSFPFDPDPGQDWCSTATLVNVHAKTNWDNMDADDVELSEVYWNIADGETPSLRTIAD